MQTLIRVIPEKEPEHAEFYVHCKDQACTAELLVLSWCSRVGLVLYFLLLLWEAEYRYLKSVAKDLNSGTAGRILLIDLEEKPGTPEEFFAVLETYCQKSSIALEYVKKDIPATVRLDGRLHTVALTESYMYGGPGWSLEIQEIL